MTFHMDGRILGANDYVLNLLGYTHEEVHQGHIRWDQLTPPEFWQRERQAHSELAVTGVCTPLQKEFIRKDGGRVTIWVGGALVPSSDHGVCFVLDITKQKELEESLKNSERKFRALTEHATLGIGQARDIRRMEYMNPTLRDWFGIPQTEVLNNLSFLDYCTPESALRIQDELKQRMLGQASVYEIEVISRQGRRRNLVVSGTPLTNEAGEVDSFIATFVDISDIKKNLSMLKLLVESIPDGVLLVDENGCILAFNHRFAEVCGFPEDLLLRPDNGPILNFLRDHLVDPETFFRRLVTNYELSATDFPDNIVELKNGRFIEVYRKALPLGPQSTIRVICIRDVTAKTKIDLHLMHTDRMATMGALMAGMAHEINNPLTHVIGGLEQIQNRLGAEAELSKEDIKDLHQRVGNLLKSSVRISEIVKDLNLFSRNENESLEPVDPRLAMETILPLVQAEIKSRARLIKDFSEVPLCLANEGRLGQVFLNLIVNALQAMPAETSGANELHLSIKCTSPSWIEIEVRDNGVGIPAEDLSRIFQPFFTTKPIGTGTGLGLSICFNLVQTFKGEIQVDSQVGKGTSFKVFLPLAKAASIPLQPEKYQPALRQKKILVVDDEEEIRELIASELSEDNEVWTAQNGLRAMEVLRDQGANVDIIVCDLIMAGMSGMELFRQASSEWPGIDQKFLFLTGGAINDEAREILEERGSQVVMKPFSLEQLREVMTLRFAPALEAKPSSHKSAKLKETLP